MFLGTILWVALAQSVAASTANPFVGHWTADLSKSTLHANSKVRSINLQVAISGDAPEQKLRQLVAWADAHSPVGCTVREPGACALEVQVV